MSSTHMAQHYRNRRLGLRLSLTQLARMVGYKNVSKGHRKIDLFERTGACHFLLFAKLTVALGIDERTRNRLEYLDYKEWLAAPANPPAPYMIRTGLRGCLGLPAEATTVEEMERYASAYARRNRTNVCLVLSRRIAVRFAEDGTLRDIIERQPPENPRTL